MNSFDSKAIIFDLDGTLIDSAEGIRQSIKNSFNHLNIDLEIDLNDLKIGPPLNETLLQCNKNITQSNLLTVTCSYGITISRSSGKNLNTNTVVLNSKRT